MGEAQDGWDAAIRHALSEINSAGLRECDNTRIIRRILWGLRDKALDERRDECGLDNDGGEA